MNVSIFSRKLSPPKVNGCNFVTSAISSVLGRNGSCTLRGWGVHMPFVLFLFSALSRFFVHKVQLTAPVYIESHWILGDVHDAFRCAYVRVVRRRLLSHHKPVFYTVTPSPTMREFGGRTSM